MKKSKDKLGQILLNEKIITEDELAKALEVQKKEGGKLGEILQKLVPKEEGSDETSADTQ